MANVKSAEWAWGTPVTAISRLDTEPPMIALVQFILWGPQLAPDSMDRGYWLPTYAIFPISMWLITKHEREQVF